MAGIAIPCGFFFFQKSDCYLKDFSVWKERTAMLTHVYSFEAICNLFYFLTAQ